MLLLRLFFPVALLTLPLPACFAQTASIHQPDSVATSPRALTGFIVDELNNPLAGVTVRLVDNPHQLLCITNSAGRFLLDVPASSGLISVTFAGYYPQQVSFGPSKKASITLLPLPGFRRDRKARVIYRRHNRAVSANPDI